MKHDNRKWRHSNEDDAFLFPGKWRIIESRQQAILR